LLPDNTWMQQMDIKTVGKAREVQMSGETTSTSKLIELFEQSQVLKNAQTRGTITRGSQPNTERFMIVAEPRPRTMPEATTVADIPVPVAPVTRAPGAPAAVPPPTAVVTPAQAGVGGSPGMILNNSNPPPAAPPNSKAAAPKGAAPK
jgi:hypothetical protein